MSDIQIDEFDRAKRRRCEFIALCKSVGDGIARHRSIERHSTPKQQQGRDNHATLIIYTLSPLVQQPQLAISHGGYRP